MEKLMSQKEVAEYLGYSIAGLERLRRVGEGPEYVKVGHFVKYTEKAIQSWLDERTYNKQEIA